VPSPPSHYHCDLFTSARQAVRAFITRRGQRAGRESPGPRDASPPPPSFQIRAESRRPPTSLPAAPVTARYDESCIVPRPRSPSCARPPACLLAGVDPAKRVVLLRSTGLAGSLLILLVVLFPGGRPAAFISSRLAPSSEPALCAADPAGFPFFNSRDTRFSNFLSVFVQTRGFLSPLRVFIFGIQDLLHSFSWKPEDNSQKKRFFFCISSPRRFSTSGLLLL
jgi:hypothetical protein